MKTLVITTPGNIRLTIYPVGTVTVQKADGMVTKAVIKIHGPGEALTYECKETAEEINAMLATTCNPSEADIAERVRLLRKACTVIAHPSDVSGLGRYNYHFACLEDGPYYLQNRNLVWSAASPEEFAAEIERVAIRQLLAERGAK